MTWRKLRVLIERLPAESATMTAIRRDNPLPAEGDVDPEAGRWSQSDMLLAALVDELRRSNYYLLMVNGAKRLKPPKPVPRPGVAPAGKPRRLNAAGADLLLNLINGTGG
jgi:hypothetical protein